ncbi:MAG: TIGR02679 domain-containing protein [Alkalibacterium thalassium]|nr:TIGR02679 domain-containing protein [Alkalibacterium thalassium]
MSKQDHQSIQYFKAHALYKKLFSEFKKKYESLGKIGGSVSLIQFLDNEIEELAEFLGLRPDILLKKRRITLLQFEKQLKKYKFDDLDLRQLLELYFGESLISNSQRQEQQALELWSYLNHLKMNYSSAEIWLDYLEGKSSDSYWIYRLMEESYDDFESYVDILDRVLQNIPENPIRLPAFAQQMTGNPHAFDRNQNLGRLLIHVLTVREARYDHKKGGYSDNQ